MLHDPDFAHLDDDELMDLFNETEDDSPLEERVYAETVRRKLNEGFPGMKL